MEHTLVVTRQQQIACQPLCQEKKTKNKKSHLYTVAVWGPNPLLWSGNGFGALLYWLAGAAGYVGRSEWGRLAAYECTLCMRSCKCLVAPLGAHTNRAGQGGGKLGEARATHVMLC